MDTIKKISKFLYSLFFASEIEQSEPEMMYTICFDEFNQAQAYTKFACGHTFHFKCAIEYLIHGITNIHEIFLPRKLCPNCQAIIVYEALPPEHIRPLNRGGNLHPGEGSTALFLNQNPSRLFPDSFIHQANKPVMTYQF